jgi:putative membrane protein
MMKVNLIGHAGWSWVLVLSGLSLAACERRDPPLTPSTQSGNAAEPAMSTGALSDSDQRFVNSAAMSGMLEEEAAKLAADKATQPQVKEFANTLLKHHQNANDELKALAKSKGISYPQALSTTQSAQVQSMASLQGTEFDNRFVSQVGVQGHQSAIALYEGAAAGAQDREVQAWAAKSLPTLREHLAIAQKLPGATQMAMPASGPASS